MNETQVPFTDPTVEGATSAFAGKSDQLVEGVKLPGARSSSPITENSVAISLDGRWCLWEAHSLRAGFWF